MNRFSNVSYNGSVPSKHQQLNEQKPVRHNQNPLKEQKPTVQILLGPFFYVNISVFS